MTEQTRFLIGRRYTAGFLVDPCPGCEGVHRHKQAGPQTAECGTTYTLIPDTIDHGQDSHLAKPGDPITPWATT